LLHPLIFSLPAGVPASSTVSRARAVAVRPTTGPSSGAAVASTRSLEQQLLRDPAPQQSDVWPASWTSSGVAFMDAIVQQQLLRECSSQESTPDAAVPVVRPTTRPPAVRRSTRAYEPATYWSKPQVTAARASRQSAPLAVSPMAELTAEEWAGLMEANREKLVVIAYHAPACSSCKQMGPALDQLASQFGEVAFATFDCASPAQHVFARSLGVKALPTFHAYRRLKDGSISLLAKVEGVKPIPLRNAIVSSLELKMDELEFDVGKSGNGYWP
jgi:thiol-disulfide isomerase/thioredoxin